MSRFLSLLSLLGLPALLQAQQTSLLSTAEAGQLSRRASQLMESTSIALPELGRLAKPLLDSAQGHAVLLEQGQITGPIVYGLLTDMRSFLTLADLTPKPYPFPQEYFRQVNELREVEQRFQAHFAALLDQREQFLRSPDRDNLARYAEANRTQSKPSGQGPRVVFLGDSITDAWRLNEYFPGRDYLNRGISGQITGEMLGRMKSDVIDLKPAAMVLLGGTNDIRRGVALTTIQNNISMLADLADTHSIKLIVASILPVHSYNKQDHPNADQLTLRPPEKIRAMNDWIRAFCNSGRCTYLDYFSDMVDPAGMLKKDLADDGLHPNSSGYRIMAQVADGVLQAALPATPTQQKRPKRRLIF